MFSKLRICFPCSLQTPLTRPEKDLDAVCGEYDGPFFFLSSTPTPSRYLIFSKLRLPLWEMLQHPIKCMLHSVPNMWGIPWGSDAADTINFQLGLHADRSSRKQSYDITALNFYNDSW